MKHKITIQGVAGCYHDAAARDYFARIEPESEIETVECPSFGEMFSVLDTDPSLIGVVAIENTIAGALLQNHELLRRSSLTVVGEYKMRISHVLGAMNGQQLSDIHEVHSHPMALMQCEQWLHRHPSIRMVEAFDTAGAARSIAQTAQPGHAAVCSEYAQSVALGFSPTALIFKPKVVFSKMNQVTMAIR